MIDYNHYIGTEYKQYDAIQCNAEQRNVLRCNMQEYQLT